MALTFSLEGPAPAAAARSGCSAAPPQQEGVRSHDGADKGAALTAPLLAKPAPGFPPPLPTPCPRRPPTPTPIYGAGPQRLGACAGGSQGRRTVAVRDRWGRAGELVEGGPCKRRVWGLVEGGPCMRRRIFVATLVCAHCCGWRWWGFVGDG